MWALVIHPANIYTLSTNWISIRNVLSEQNKCVCGRHRIFSTKKKANKQVNKIYSRITDYFGGLVLTEELLHFFEVFCLTSLYPSQESFRTESQGGFPQKTLCSPLCSSQLEMTKKSKRVFKSYLEAMLTLSHLTYQSFLFHFFPLYCSEQQIHVQQEKKMEERCFWGGETREKEKQNWIRIYMGLLFTDWAGREALCHLVMSKRSCNSIDCSPQDHSVHRISRARMLEWVPISFSRGIFPTQGLNLCLLHWQADSFPGNHQGRLVYGVDIVILKLNFNYLSIIYLILPLQAIKSNYNVSTDILVKNVTVFKTINTSAEKQRSNVNMYEKKQQ